MLGNDKILKSYLLSCTGITAEFCLLLFFQLNICCSWRPAVICRSLKHLLPSPSGTFLVPILLRHNTHANYCYLLSVYIAQYILYMANILIYLN